LRRFVLMAETFAMSVRANHYRLLRKEDREMRIEFFKNYVKVERGDDPRISSESQLLYKLKNELNDMGGASAGEHKNQPFVKKLMSRDGHMVADTQHYIRAKDPKKVPEGMPWAIHHDRYAIEDAAARYNRDGTVELKLERV
jgi:hypothetical protein